MTTVCKSPIEQRTRPSRDEDRDQHDERAEQQTRSRNRNPSERELLRQIGPHATDYRRVLQKRTYAYKLNKHPTLSKAVRLLQKRCNHQSFFERPTQNCQKVSLTRSKRKTKMVDQNRSKNLEKTKSKSKLSPYQRRQLCEPPFVTASPEFRMF